MKIVDVWMWKFG